MDNDAFVPLKLGDEEIVDILSFNSLCWRCKEPLTIVTYDLQLGGYNCHLGRFPMLDEILLKKYPENLVKRLSKTQETVVISNLCKNCDVIQGDFYLWENFAEQQPKFIERLKFKISEIMTEKELEEVNQQEKEVYEEDF
jgi:hypothetical protein